VKDAKSSNSNDREHLIQMKLRGKTVSGNPLASFNYFSSCEFEFHIMEICFHSSLFLASRQLFVLFLFPCHGRERASSNSSFSLIRTRFPYTARPFFTPPFSSPFHFTRVPLLLSYTMRIADSYSSYHFFFSSFPAPHLLFYFLASFLLLVRRLRRSLSIRRRSRGRFLYCICSPVSSLFSCSVRGSR